MKPRPFLTREALYWLTLFAPAIALLVSRSGTEPVQMDRVVGCLLATWIITVVCGVSLHFTVEAVAPRLLARTTPPLAILGLVAIGAVIVSVEMELLMPRLVWLDGNLAGSPPKHVLQALALGGIYVSVTRLVTWLQNRARESEERSLKARLAALQSQVNPHFLFNTLNAIASLIPTDPARAEQTVERLGSVLQYTIAKGARGRVTVAEELAVVRDYLEIEGARFGARLRSRVEIDPAVEEDSIPPMIVQPLVENAVLHGLSGRDEGGTVVVEGRAEEGAMVLRVSDDGVGPGGSKRRGNRTGLENLRERLALTYGAAARLTVGAREGGGFECEIRLPRPTP